MKRKILLLTTIMLAPTLLSGCGCSDKEPKKDDPIPVDPIIEDEKFINLDKTDVSLYVGQTYQFNVSTNIEGEVTWISDNKNVADISNGLLTAYSEGTCNIAAIIQDKAASATVTVLGDKFTISLSTDTVVLGLNDYFTVKADFYAYGEKQSVTFDWSSDDSNVVTVENGLITAVGYGETNVNVSATYEEVLTTSTIDVKVKFDGSLTFGSNEYDLDIVDKDNNPGTLLLEPLLKIEGIVVPNPTIEYESTNAEILTVNTNGVVTAIREGSAVINAKYKVSEGIYVTGGVQINVTLFKVTLDETLYMSPQTLGFKNHIDGFSSEIVKKVLIDNQQVNARFEEDLLIFGDEVPSMFSIGDHIVSIKTDKKVYEANLFNATKLITSAQDMVDMLNAAQLVKKTLIGYEGYYFLTNDIDLSTVLNTGALREVAYNGADCGTGQGFNAYFDGLGHLIKGVNLLGSGTDDRFLGLFGSLGKDAVIKNLVVEMELGWANTNFTQGGGLCYNCKGLIENVCVKGNIKNGGKAAYNSLFCANLQASGKIKDCLGIDLSSDGFDKVGLLAGNVDSGLEQIENSYALTKAEKAKAGTYNYAIRTIGKNLDEHVDAIVATLKEWFEGLEDNPFKGILKAKGSDLFWFETKIGKLNDGSDLTNAIQLGKTTKEFSLNIIKDDIVSNVSIDGNQVAFTQTAERLSFTDLSSIATGLHTILIETNNQNITSDLLVVDEISTAGEMKDILDAAQNVKATANGYQGYFVLTNDIDLSTVLNTGALREVAYNGAGCGSGQGFNAYFDGQGHLIKGVNLLGSGSTARYLGLFGSLGKDAIVKNLVVEMELGWASTTYTQGGGLAYNCNGLIENVCVKGNIKNGGNAVYNSLFCATLQANGKIKNCLGIDLSTSGFDKVGLMAGNVAGLAQIENSYALTQAEKINPGTYNYFIRAIAGDISDPVNAIISDLESWYKGLEDVPFENIYDDMSNIYWLSSVIGNLN